MTQFVMVVASSARPGAEDEYTTWYDTKHIHEICATPGVISGKRFTASAASPSPMPGHYLAIYEIETDDITGVLAEMGRRSAAGETSHSDALDRESVKMWFYEAR